MGHTVFKKLLYSHHLHIDEHSQMMCTYKQNHLTNSVHVL